MTRVLVKDCISQTGQTVTVMGWVNTMRTHGGINFIDLRDRSGILQLVGGPELKSVHLEDTVSVTGSVVNRSPETVNPDLPSGTVELKVENFSILSKAKAVPFPIDTDGRDIDEELRLKYRYLDLRRPRLQHHLKIRSHYVQALREYLFTQDFTEIETPLLTKSTPEGSRDFVVPSRIYPGKFYALPQSPQQYKQLLMAGGFERYFQVARCLRDEDPRADRAYEHTQLDLEMSFVTREEVMAVVEGMVTHAVNSIGASITQSPFPVITYQEALSRFGSDKFDLRNDEQKQNHELAFAWVIDFPFFEKNSQGEWTFTHNPFSGPIPDHESWLMSKQNIGQIITNQYDLVCNGMEVGGGSIRSYKPEVLRSVFSIMGYTDEEIDQKFGHMLEAFTFGTPPHGGCAHGFERLLMALWDESSIHEVQAFPQTNRGRTSVMDAPSDLPPVQLVELGLEISQKSFATPYDHLLDLLNSHAIPYKLYEHPPVYTSQEAAAIRGDVTEHQGAKAMVLEVNGKDLILYILPGDQRADLNALKIFLNARRVAIAAKESVYKKTGLEVGSIPPFGSVIGLPSYVDTQLADNEEIVFNAARHDRSIKMKYQDYLNLEKPTQVTVKNG